jgi:hypothetical protein
LLARLAPIVICCAPWLAAGCGAETYEQRLEITGKYFRSLELQKANLAETWVDPETGISLRPPRQFELLPPPEPKPEDEQAAEQPQGDSKRADAPRNAAGGSEAEDGEAGDAEQNDEGKPDEPATPDEEEETPDPRQPEYLPDLRLPGLRGAFRAPLTVVDEDNRDAEGRGYIYVMTNHHLAGNEERARGFHDDLVKLLGEALNMRARPDDLHDQSFPTRKDAFMKPIKYRSLELVPEEPIGSLAREFGVATRFSLYLHEFEAVQAAVLFVLPRDAATKESLALRVPLCLETLRIPDGNLFKPGSRQTSIGGAEPGKGF